MTKNILEHYPGLCNTLPFCVKPALMYRASTAGCKSPAVPQVRSCQPTLLVSIEAFVLLSPQMDHKLMFPLLLYSAGTEAGKWL